MGRADHAAKPVEVRAAARHPCESAAAQARSRLAVEQAGFLAKRFDI
jgi:hypothetical protein